MRLGTMQALAALDIVLSSEDEETAREVWCVLTALRGPDADDPVEDVKYATTAVIRTAAFPKTAERREAGYAQIGAIFAPLERVYKYPDDGPNIGGEEHFRFHAEKAAGVLGLLP